MKIENLLKTSSLSGVKEVKSNRSRSSSKSSVQKGIRDEVELTGSADKLRELETSLAEVDVTDTGKVESIRQAIAEGSFQVDDEAVAERLVNETLDQLSHRLKQ